MNFLCRIAGWAALSMGILLSPITHGQSTTYTDLVKIHTFSSVKGAPAGMSVWAAVRLEIEAPWHINANDPSEEFQIKTILAFDKSALKVEEILYPEGSLEAFSYTASPIRVYSGTVIIFFKISVPLHTPPGKYAVQGKLEMQACDDEVCLAPTEMPVILEINVINKDNSIESIHQEIFKDMT